MKQYLSDTLYYIYDEEIFIVPILTISKKK